MMGTRTAPAGGTHATLFTTMLDDAAIFPPGDAPMGEAVDAHRVWAASRWAHLVGPFVCSSARWDELRAHLTGGPPLPVSLTVPEGTAQVPRVVARALAEPRVDLVSVEVPVSAEALPVLAAQVAEHVPQRVRVYAELARRDLGAAQLDVLVRAGLRLKIRTGGTHASAFPDEGELGGALWTAVRGGLPFKLTAGLHDAVRHRGPVTGFEHHGYLNVLAATARALSGHGLVSVVDALAVQEPERVAEEVAALDTDVARRARRYFVGFGTCSIGDPLDGLLDLGLLEGQRR